MNIFVLYYNRRIPPLCGTAPTCLSVPGRQVGALPSEEQWPEILLLAPGRASSSAEVAPHRHASPRTEAASRWKYPTDSTAGSARRGKFAFFTTFSDSTRNFFWPKIWLQICRIDWWKQNWWSTRLRAVKRIGSVGQCVWDLETPKQGGHHGTKFARSTQFYYVHSTFLQNQPISIQNWLVSMFYAF